MDINYTNEHKISIKKVARTHIAKNSEPYAGDKSIADDLFQDFTNTLYGAFAESRSIDDYEVPHPIKSGKFIIPYIYIYILIRKFPVT